ncbi:MAG: UDP-N-acetylmuramoyl-L-alanyl-D-glutamate--2,6-diaminopimelate ligase [Gammaproteobacteria bacterium]
MNARTNHAPGAGHAASWPPKSLRELLRGLAEVTQRDERRIAGLSQDSRSIGAGELFIAVPGAAHDGRDYIEDALHNGAAAIAREKSPARARHAGHAPSFDIADLQHHIGAIAARFFDHPSAHMRIIGITGTNGKTTCAYLLAQALGALGRRCALMGTLGAGFIGALRPIAGEMTTPGAIDTQRILAELLAMRAAAVCVEASSHALAQGRAAAVEFDVALLTNLSRDHLDYHRDMRAYARAKEVLFRGARLGAAVINIDDPFGRKLLRRHRADNCLRYGLRGGDVRAHDVQVSDAGIELELEHKTRRARLRSSLLGALNVPNLIAAAATLIACGYELGAAAAALGNCVPPPGRMELLRAESQPGVVVDYAHTPDALARALESLRALCRGRLWVVFGCGGGRDHGKRAQMGAAAEAGAARVIITDDNPRFEDPAQITAHIAAGMRAAPIIIHGRRRAIHAALSAAAPDDIVLVAGKGHETTQNCGARMLHFNDREAVMQALGMAEGAAA